MNTLGIDPGDKSPGFYWLGAGKWSQSPIDTGDHAIPVFVEGQFPRPKSSRQSLMTLSFYAGIQAGYYLAKGHTVYPLQPKLWRETLIRNSGTMPKTVFHNRLRREGRIPDEVWCLAEDVIDAFLIATAGRVLTIKNDLPKPLQWSAKR